MFSSVGAAGSCNFSFCECVVFTLKMIMQWELWNTPDEGGHASLLRLYVDL